MWVVWKPPEHDREPEAAEPDWYIEEEPRLNRVAEQRGGDEQDDVAPCDERCASLCLGRTEGGHRSEPLPESGGKQPEATRNDS